MLESQPNGRADELKAWAWGAVDHVVWLRQGAEAARFLAEELERVAREEGNDETPPPVA